MVMKSFLFLKIGDTSYGSHRHIPTCFEIVGEVVSLAIQHVAGFEIMFVDCSDIVFLSFSFSLPLPLPLTPNIPYIFAARLLVTSSFEF